MFLLWWLDGKVTWELEGLVEHGLGLGDVVLEAAHRVAHVVQILHRGQRVGRELVQLVSLHTPHALHLTPKANLPPGYW